jgi:mRNA interferase MazF
VGIRFQNKSGWIVLDQIRTVDKNRLVRKLGGLEEKNKQQVKDVLQAMLVD